MSFLDEILDDIENIENDLRKQIRNRIVKGIKGKLDELFNSSGSNDKISTIEKIPEESEEYEIIEDIKNPETESVKE